MKVLLFQTNIHHPEQKHLLEDCFKDMKGVFNWDIDFEDEHYILRVVGSGIKPEDVKEKLAGAGFTCDEIE